MKSFVTASRFKVEIFRSLCNAVLIIYRGIFDYFSQIEMLVANTNFKGFSLISCLNAHDRR